MPRDETRAGGPIVALRAFLDNQRHRYVSMPVFIIYATFMGVAVLVGLLVVQSIVAGIAHRSTTRDTQLCEVANLATAFRPLFIAVPSVVAEIDTFVADVHTNDPECLVQDFPAPPVPPPATVTVTPHHGKGGRGHPTVVTVTPGPPATVTVTPHPTGPAPAPTPSKHHRHHPTPKPSRTCLYTLPVTGQPVCLPRTSPLAVPS